MLEDSRIKIYEYLEGLVKGKVSDNVYWMNEPQELTESDVQDGFIVIRVGDLIDESEFAHNTYNHARCYMEVYIPPKSRGRIDKTKYTQYETAMNAVINEAIAADYGDYSVQEDSVISVDAFETNNQNNTFFTFVKSFIVII